MHPIFQTLKTNGVPIFGDFLSLDVFNIRTMHAKCRTIMVSHFSIQKSSANYLAPRVFAQKGNGVTVFGHFFCPFSEIFLTLVQSKNKK
jgi:hypothetical protein